MTGVEFGLTLALALVAVGLFPRLSAKQLLVAVPVAVVVVMAASLWLFLVNHVWAPPLYPALALLLPFGMSCLVKKAE